jgi:hypothetical protein
MRYRRADSSGPATYHKYTHFLINIRRSGGKLDRHKIPPYKTNQFPKMSEK